LSGHRRPVGPY